MALIVNHNIPALQSYNAVNMTSGALEKSIQKLSTGLRINSAADDAAGLAISEKMRAQIRGLDRAVMNSQDGISMIQTAEGALVETQSILQRMRELSVQAANDTLTQQDRAYIQLEIDQLREEVSRVGNTTQFNKKKLLDGSAAALWSTDKQATKAIIKGGLRQIDPFGQKNSFEGNFIIDINAAAGKAQVQKSDVFTIKHKDVVMNVSATAEAGVSGVSVNNIPAGGYAVSAGTAAGFTAGSSALVSGSGAGTSTLVTALTPSATTGINIQSVSGKGIKLTAKILAARGAAGSAELDIEFSDASNPSKKAVYTFSTAGITAKSGTLANIRSDLAFAPGSTGLSAAFDPSEVRAGMVVDVSVAGAATLSRGTGAPLDDFTALDAALALGSAAPVVTAMDADGNAITDFAIVLNKGVAGSSDVHFTIARAVKFGDSVLYAADSQSYTVTAAAGSNSVTTRDGITFTFDAAYLTASNGTDVYTNVSLASSLGAATLSSAANNVFIAAPPTVTVASNGSGNPAFDPTKTLTVDIERGSAGNEIHVTVHYDGVNRGSISGVTANLAANGVTTVDLSSLGLGFDLVLTNGATAPTLAPFIPGGGPKDTYTYAAVKGGSRILTTTASNVANSAGAAFAAGAALHNANTGVKFATTTASQGGRLTLKVSSYDKAAKTVTFRGIFGNGTDAGTVTMTQNNVVGATGMMAGWNLSGGLGIDAALTNISIGDEVDFDVVAASASNVQLVGKYGQAGFATGAASSDLSLTAVGAVSNASLLLEVEQIVGSTVTFKVTSNILNADGSTSTFVSKMLVTENASATDPNQVGLAFITQLAPGGSQNFKVGDKMAYNVSSVSQAGGVSGASADSYIAIRGRQAGRKEWVDGWSSGGAPGVTDSVTYADRALLFGLDTSKVKGQEVHFKNFYINEDNGTVYSGDITLSLNGNFGKAAFGTNLGTFTAAYLGQLAEEDVKLRDLDKFWNSEGRFLLQDAQTLTITQGDGARGSVTLYATDTLKDVAVKLNGAIAKQLGQGRLLSSTGYDSAAERFTTFVREKKPDTSEAVRGTFVIRSVIAGVNGEISFAGDEDLLKALSLNEIQASEENSFTVSVWDAHNGKSVANGVKITGNKLIDVVNENVDVTFDPMANIKITWNDPTKSFMLTKANGSYQTTLHLADNTTVFQIGANEGEDMGVNIGDMRAEALGLNQVLVTDRKAAARSVTVIDNALDKVSSQRAKLGAYQNRLEHTINNLTAASQNLTASESRIRDTDMAKEMMNFTKLQIMLQAGTSMLAQANAMPQNVLSLIR